MWLLATDDDDAVGVAGHTLGENECTSSSRFCLELGCGLYVCGVIRHELDFVGGRSVVAPNTEGLHE